MEENEEGVIESYTSARIITREQKSLEDLIDIVADVLDTIDAPTDGKQWKIQKLKNRLADLNTEISEWVNQ